MAFKKLGIAALALVGTGLAVVPRSFASAPAAAEVVHPAAAAAVLIVNSGGTCKSEFCFSPSAITVRPRVRTRRTAPRIGWPTSALKRCR